MAVVCLACAVSACSCDKSPTNPVLPPPPPPVNRTYSVKVLSPTSSPLKDASIFLQTRSQNYVATSGSDGMARFQIPNTVALPPLVVFVVTHSIIMPEAITCPGGQNATADRVVSTVAMPAHPLVRDVYLHHLGNDLYGGEANSQLQLPTEGTSVSYPFSLSALPASMPRIRLFGRGIQYPTVVSINGKVVSTLGNSSSDGSLSFYSFQVGGTPLNNLKIGNNTLTIKTASIVSQSDPWDDIEVCGLMLYNP
jgi:hypothetical protein